MTVSSSLPLTWSRCHNGVWSVKTFKWEAASFGPRHFQTVQTGDVWLSLHLMSKLTWATWRCSNAICSFPFMLYHQINKSQRGSMTAGVVYSLLALMGLLHPAVRLPVVSFHKFIVSSLYQQWPFWPEGYFSLWLTVSLNPSVFNSCDVQ